MESDFTITKRDYMCIIARYSTWCIEHKINDDNVTKDDIDKFIAYMSILNRFDVDVVESALRQYFSYFNDSELIENLGLNTFFLITPIGVIFLLSDLKSIIWI